MHVDPRYTPLKWQIPLTVMHISISLWSQIGKIPKRLIISVPLRTLVRLKYCSGGLVSHYFYGAADKPAVISQQSQASVQRKRQAR